MQIFYTLQTREELKSLNETEIKKSWSKKRMINHLLHRKLQEFEDEVSKVTN